MSGRSARRVVASVLAAFAAVLVTAAPAWAHGRNVAVALDYRLTMRTPPPGIRVAILDGDRALLLSLASAHAAIVLGDLGEPMLRFRDGVWVNLSSPTAQANRLVGNPGHGWKRVGRGTSFAWHEHRLAPPPFVVGRYGPVAQWHIPVLVDGRRSTLGGAFVRAPRPTWWLWLALPVLVAVAFGYAIGKVRPRRRVVITLAAFALAAAAALVCETALILRDSPTGHRSWVGVGVGIVVAACAVGLVAFGRGTTRAYTAGGIGAGVAAWTLSWLGVFFHGAVIAALPGGAVRACCALALGGGLVAVAGGLSVHE